MTNTDTQSPETPQPHISRITIDRLFNLGSYEHVKYGLTIDIPNGCDLKVASVFVGVERLLEALNPKTLNSCKSESELKREELRLKKAALMTDEQFARQYGHAGMSYVGTRAQYQERMRQSWEESKQRRADMCALAEKARQLLDDLGGAAVWKDAKLDWEND